MFWFLEFSLNGKSLMNHLSILLQTTSRFREKKNWSSKESLPNPNRQSHCEQVVDLKKKNFWLSERESHLNSWSHHHAKLQHHQNNVAKTSTTDLLRSRYVESWCGWLTMVWGGGRDEECSSYGGWKIWKRGGRRSRIQKLWDVNCFTPF